MWMVFVSRVEDNQIMWMHQSSDINTSDCNHHHQQQKPLTNSSCEASPLTSMLCTSPSVPQPQQLEPTTRMGQQIRQNVPQQVHILPGQTTIQRLIKAVQSLPPELLLSTCCLSDKIKTQDQCLVQEEWKRGATLLECLRIQKLSQPIHVGSRGADFLPTILGSRRIKKQMRGS